MKKEKVSNMKCPHCHKDMSPKKPGKKAAKVKKVMHEFKEHKLHSGSKKGPEVTNPKQAIAIALSESRKLNKKRK
jgi:hypothetical protein